MSIHRVDKSCRESSHPREGEDLAVRGDGSYLGDEYFINDFFKLKGMIEASDHAHDHRPLKEAAEKFGDINAQLRCTSGQESVTLLYLAAKKGCHVCADILLKRGANPEVKCNGETARSVADQSKVPQLIEVFEKSKVPSKVEKVNTHEITCKWVSGSQYHNQYKGWFKFGPLPEDNANVSFSVGNSNFSPTMPFKLTVEKGQYEERTAYYISYDKTKYNYSIVNMIPNLSKYQMGTVGGKDLFVEQEKQKKDDCCACAIS